MSANLSHGHIATEEFGGNGPRIRDINARMHGDIVAIK